MWYRCNLEKTKGQSTVWGEQEWRKCQKVFFRNFPSINLIFLLCNLIHCRCVTCFFPRISQGPWASGTISGFLQVLLPNSTFSLDWSIISNCNKLKWVLLYSTSSESFVVFCFSSWKTWLLVMLSVTSNINLMVLTNSLMDFFITKSDVYKFEHAVLRKDSLLEEVAIGMKKGK